MKTALVLVLAVLLAAPAVAQADWLLTYRDTGATEVWADCVQTKTEYCTNRPLVGRYCVRKADISSIKQVPAGTRGTEYGMSTMGDDSAAASRDQANTVYDRMDRDLAKQKAEQTRKDKQYARELDKRKEVEKKTWGQ